jgi:hypothetical protein
MTTTDQQQKALFECHTAHNQPNQPKGMVWLVINGRVLDGYPNAQNLVLI